LRGAILQQVVNTTSSCVLTMNANAFADNGDNTDAVYYGNTGTFTSCTVNIYEEFLDQLPRSNGKYILPMQDLSVVYMLQQTNFTGLTANQEFPIPFNNFRSYYSVNTIFNPNSTGANRAFGTDLTTIANQTANATYINRDTPLLTALLEREVTGADLPAGTYYHSFRENPIYTTQSGNRQLVYTPTNAVTANAYIRAYWEYTQLQGTLQGGSSLAAS
jgi:hypothetical protein